MRAAASTSTHTHIYICIMYIYRYMSICRCQFVASRKLPRCICVAFHHTCVACVELLNNLNNLKFPTRFFALCFHAFRFVFCCFVCSGPSFCGFFVFLVVGRINLTTKAGEFCLGFRVNRFIFLFFFFVATSDNYKVSRRLYVCVSIGLSKFIYKLLSLHCFL